MVVMVTGAEEDAAGGGVSGFEHAHNEANRPHTRKERFIVVFFSSSGD
jgi:hypothetical protein